MTSLTNPLVERSVKIDRLRVFRRWHVMRPFGSLGLASELVAGAQAWGSVTSLENPVWNVPLCFLSSTTGFSPWACSASRLGRGGGAQAEGRREFTRERNVWNVR